MDINFFFSIYIIEKKIYLFIYSINHNHLKKNIKKKKKKKKNNNL